MTREDAIELLDNLVGMVSDNQDSDYDTALKMAIKALEQEPCEDAISRKTVLSIIDGWYEQNRETENIEDLIILITYMDSVTPKPTEYEDAISREDATAEFIKWQTEVAYAFGRDYLGVRIIQSAIDTIRKLPPVTPRRKGHWRYMREDKYICSKCGTTTRVDEGGIDEKPMYKFCPYCGAEMESEE